LSVWGKTAFRIILAPRFARQRAGEIRMKIFLRPFSWLGFWARSLLAILAGGGAGCASQLTLAGGDAKTAPPTTGKIFSGPELHAFAPTAFIGDNYYAEVNSTWLPEWYRLYRSQLFKLGIVHWDNRFDCNRIADFYSNLAQAFFALKEFHSSTPAQALALGPFWYERADGKGRHAVIQVLTERGQVFIDPQNGKEVNLTPGERQSGYMQIF
jgi:hypothetical protein